MTLASAWLQVHGSGSRREAGFREQAIIDLALISGHGALDPLQDRMTVVGCVLMRDETDSHQAALLFSDHVSFRNTPTTDFFFFFFNSRTEKSKQVYHRKKRVRDWLISHLSWLLWISESRGRKQAQLGPFVLSQVSPRLW